MFKSQSSKLMVWLFSGLVLPSPLGFLSPGNGGIEGGVKTIEGRGEATLCNGASALYFISLSFCIQDDKVL